MSTRTTRTNNKDSSPQKGSSSSTPTSLNKHELTTYKTIRERSRSPTKTSQDNSQSPLSSITQNIKQTGGTEHIQEYQGLKVPHSAETINPTEQVTAQSKILNPLPPAPQFTMSSSQDPVSRRVTCKNMIVEYLSTKGCTTSEGAIENMVRYHTDVINDTTGSPIILKREQLDFYSEGWKDCSVQMSMLNMQTMATKLDPILGNMTNLSILLKDNVVVQLLQELKAMQEKKGGTPMEVDQKAKGKSTVSQDIGKMKKVEPPPSVPEMLQDAQARLKIIHVNEETLLAYKKKWSELTNEVRLQVIDWIGRGLLDKISSKDLGDGEKIKTFAIRMKGSRMVQLVKLHESGVPEDDLKYLAMHLYINSGTVVFPTKGVIING